MAICYIVLKNIPADPTLKPRKQVNIDEEIYNRLKAYAATLGPDTSLNTAIKYLLEGKKK